MKAARLDQLHAHLERQPPAPIYLLAGQEPLLLLEAADAVRRGAKAHGYAERDVLEAGEAGFDWNALAAAAQQGSLFGGGRKLIDLRLPTGRPGKDGAEALKAYCEQINPDNLLLITCTQWGKAWETAWVDAVSAAGGWYVPVWPVKRHELPAWIAARLGRRGLRASDEAIALLIERTEGNLLACAQEIDKLVLLGETGPLDAARLDALLAEQARLDVFALSDALMAGDAMRALRVLRGLHAEGEAAVPVIGWLGSQVEVLARVAEGQAAGQPVAQLLRAERVWDARQALYQGALRRLGAGGCRKAMLALARLDRLAKGQEFGEVWLELERFVLAFTGAARARRAA